MKKFLKIFVPVALICGVIAGLRCFDKAPQTYFSNQGEVFGTTYSITYQYDADLHEDIKKTLADVDESLSPFNKNSIITAINNNEDVKVNDHFKKVFEVAMKVSEDTDGAFDITVAPLVNAWGFGFKSGNKPGKEQVDSLLAIIGYKTISLKDDKVIKEKPETMLDCSAIAKGYGVDAVADFLTSKGIENFMVEIGGEVVTKGKNPKSDDWKIGIVKPTDDSLSINSEIQEVLKVSEMAMATSGNYRKFYVEDGKKYAHTIDPKTGYPVQHNILSATVLGPTCTICDAYATSFMVVGLEKAQEILNRHPELMAYLIYNKDGKNEIWYSQKLKEQLQ